MHFRSTWYSDWASIQINWIFIVMTRATNKLFLQKYRNISYRYISPKSLKNQHSVAACLIYQSFSSAWLIFVHLFGCSSELVVTLLHISQKIVQNIEINLFCCPDYYNSYFTIGLCCSHNQFCDSTKSHIPTSFFNWANIFEWIEIQMIIRLFWWGWAHCYCKVSADGVFFSCSFLW